VGVPETFASARLHNWARPADFFEISLTMDQRGVLLDPSPEVNREVRRSTPVPAIMSSPLELPLNRLPSYWGRFCHGSLRLILSRLCILTWHFPSSFSLS
jgi:hypothetical protein